MSQGLSSCLLAAAVVSGLFQRQVLAQAPDPVAEASAALRRGDPAVAVRVTDSALKQHPGDVRLLTLRGLAYTGEKRSSEALRDFEAALATDGRYLPALEGAAQLTYAHADGSAKPFLERILAEHPADQTANAMLGVLDYRAGDCRSAIQHFKSAPGLLPSQPDSIEEYGVCLAKLQFFGEATVMLTQAVELMPSSKIARYNLALTQWSAGRSDLALQTLSALLTGTPIPEDVLTLAADIYEAQNQSQQAVEALRQAIMSHPKEKTAYLQFANFCFKHNCVDTGIEMLNIGLEQLPQEPELYVARGVLRSQTSDLAKAVDDFNLATRLDPKLSSASVARGLANSQAHEDAAALAAFRASAREHPDDALAQYLLAEALSEKAAVPGTPEFTESLVAAQRAVLLNPQATDAHDLLASMYLRRGDNEASIQQSKAALEVDPSDDAAVYHEILAMRKSGDRPAIAELVQKLATIRAAKAGRETPKSYRSVEAAPSAAAPTQ